jgi:hypothetical protein
MRVYLNIMLLKDALTDNVSEITIHKKGDKNIVRLISASIKDEQQLLTTVDLD